MNSWAPVSGESWKPSQKSVPRLESELSLIWPTLVVPASTGATAADDPVSWSPPNRNEAKQTMLPRAVGTPGIEKAPLTEVVPVTPRQFTDAPAIRLLL